MAHRSLHTPRGRAHSSQQSDQSIKKAQNWRRLGAPEANTHQRHAQHSTILVSTEFRDIRHLLHAGT
jgi:hypothetical protein